MSCGMVSVENDPAPCKQEESLARWAGVWDMLPLPWLVLQTGCPQPQGTRGRPGRTYRGLWVLSSVFCSLLKALRPRYVVLSVGAGGWEGPQLSHPDDIVGFEAAPGRELIVVHRSHPTQEVQVLRQVHQLLHTRATARHPPSPGVPRAVTGHRTQPLGHLVPLQGEQVRQWHGEEELTLLRISCSFRYRLVTICPL